MQQTSKHGFLSSLKATLSKSSPTVAKATRRILIFFSLSVAIILSSCMTVREGVEHYRANIHRVSLGMSVEEFTAIFASTQREIGESNTRPTQRISRDGSIFDTYFIRSGWIPDSETTDDELTPHVFKDGKLISIGWEAVGGMKRTSHDIAREEAEIRKAEASATKINQIIGNSNKVQQSQNTETD